MSRIDIILCYFIEKFLQRRTKYGSSLRKNPPQPTQTQINLFYTESEWLELFANYCRTHTFDSNTIDHLNLKTLSNISWKHFNFLNKNLGSIITIDHPFYPNELKWIYNPPLAFNILGSLELLSRPKISVIGSRKASPVGLRTAYELGLELSKAGYCVVSGGAYGCDIHAHFGCLDQMLRPTPILVVLPGPLDQLIPKAHQNTFEHILKAGGTLISEQVYSSTCKKYDYILRNRLISGLSQSLFVAECDLKSGAMSTVRFALEQGKEVYTCAQQLTYGDIRASGNAKLIEEGARYFYNAREALRLNSS